MNLKEIIISTLPKEEIYENLKNLISEIDDKSKGDYCVPCFSLSKTLHKSPMDIATCLQSKLNLNEYIQKTETVGGYLNFYLNKETVSKKIVEQVLSTQEFFRSNIGEGKTICMDYSSVNLAKYMHVGHLKNTIIGESIARICENLGYKIVRINYIGDYGAPVGKIIAGYKTWGSKEDVEKRGIDALQEYYVKFYQQADENPELQDLARKTLKEIEDKDPETCALYQWIREISIKEAERILSILDVHFDSWKGESCYADDKDKVLNLLAEKGLSRESEGAVIVDLEKYDMPPYLVRRSDGASLYATRDISAAIDRYNTYHFDKMYYITGNEQQLHFKQLFKVLELLGFEFSKDLEHIHYGLFTLPSGKISSRAGKQATLVDLINLAKNKANEVIKGRTFEIEKAEDVAWKVACGALNFSAIRVETNKDCVFDVDTAFSFDGETAPYMQYSYTRIKSILRKYQQMDIDKSSMDSKVFLEENAFELIKMINNINDAILSAFNKKEPSIIVKRAMDICKTINKYYTTTKILGGTDAEINAKVNILLSVQKALQVLFNLMCIDTLEEM